MDLVVGKTYVVNIKLPFDDIPKDHMFISNRHMRYEGIDDTWKYRKSYIFSDDMDLYQELENDKQSYNVFMRMTHVCANSLKNGRWYIHICQHWHNGTKILDVRDI